MITFRKALILWIFLLLGINVYSQCDIGGLVVKNLECNANSYYEFDLNFSISNDGIDSFDVYSNDIFLSRHSIFELPVHIYNDTYVDGDTIDILKVVNSNDPDCFNATEVNNPCPCIIFDFEYTKYNCTDSTFNVLLDFKHLRTSDSFQIGMKEHYWGKFRYKDLPLKLDNFHVRDTLYSPIVVDLKNPIFCSDGFDLNPDPCPKCKMDNLKLLSYECDEDYNINMYLSFDYEYNSSTGYDIYIPEMDYLKKLQYTNSTSNSEQIFTDSIALTGLEIACEDQIQIKLTDIDKSDCSTTITVDSFCCEPCKIEDLKAENIECTSTTTFSMVVDFEFSENRKDSFDLFIGGNYNGKYSVNDIPLKLENLPLNSEISDTVKVCMDNDKCCESLEFNFPVCDYFDCQINDISYKIEFDTIDSYWIIIDSISTKNTSDSFQLYSNSQYMGEFAYSELPIKTDNYLCEDVINIEFVLEDTKAGNCNFSFNIENIKCPTTGIKYVEKNADWNIYSSYDSKKLIVKLINTNFNDEKLIIYNSIGNVVKSEKLQKGKSYAEITLHPLKTGVYFAAIYNNSRPIVSRKIFVR